MKRFIDTFQPILGPVALVVVWQAFAQIANADLLPTPVMVTERLVSLMQTERFGIDLISTLYRWFAGYLAGCIVGTPIGLLLGARPTLYRSSEFLLDFFRSLPVTAVFPLFLLLFGIGDASKIAMVFAATVFVVALNGAYGVLNSTPVRIRMAHTYGASEWQIFRHVVLYEAAPQLLIGMRTTLSLSLIVVIVSEMFIGTRYGLGQRVFDSYQTNVIVDLYAFLMVIGLIGYVANKVFALVERRFIYWAGQ